MSRTLNFNINLESNAGKIAGQMVVSMADLERAMESATKATQKFVGAFDR